MEDYSRGNFGQMLTDQDLIRLGILDPTGAKGSGLSGYIPIEMLTDAIEYQLKPELAKPYTFSINDGVSNQIYSGARVGIRYAHITLTLSLNQFRLEVDPLRPSRLFLTVLNEKVGGIIGLHIAQEAPFGWGDIHNKVYTINFQLKIKNLTFAVDMGATSDGYPKLDITLSLEGLDVRDDLEYTVQEKDLLTFIAGVSEVFWIGEINKVIRNELLPLLTSKMSHLVETKIRDLWRNHFDFEHGTNLRIHLNIESIVTTGKFVRLLVDGHIENTNFVGRTNEKSPIHHQCETLKDISHLIGLKKKIYIQCADCVLQSAINSYFQNPLELEMPLTGNWFESLKISHKPESRLSSTFRREEHPADPTSLGLAIRATGDFEFRVKQKLPIPIHFFARASIEFTEPTYWGASQNAVNKVTFSLEIKKPDIEEMQDSDGQPKQLGEKGIATVLPNLREKLAKITHTKTADLSVLRLHDKCWLVPDLLHVLSDGLLMTLEVVYL